MASRKQEIYCQLLYHGLLELRMLCTRGSHVTAEEMFGLQSEFELGWERANFLHRVHISLLEPEYVSNDISFINWAFPCHIERLGDRLGAETAALMLEFYENVPEAMRSQLEWHPSAEFRSLAAKH